MGITQEQFDAIAKGQRLSYCADGDFVVTGVHKNAAGKTLKLTVKSTTGGGDLTLDKGDTSEIDLLS